jgi:hypothetical protein
VYRVVSTAEVLDVKLRFVARHDESALDCMLKFAYVSLPLRLT